MTVGLIILAIIVFIVLLVFLVNKVGGLESTINNKKISYLAFSRQHPDWTKDQIYLACLNIDPIFDNKDELKYQISIECENYRDLVYLALVAKGFNKHKSTDEIKRIIENYIPSNY